MKTGISTACLYPETIESSLDLLLSAGFLDFELFINTHSELSSAFISQMRNAVQNAGGSIVSLHPFTSGYEPMMFFSEYQRRFDDSLEFYKRYFDAAASCNAAFLVFHGGNLYCTLTLDEYCHRFARINEIAKKFGVIVAQENVNGFLGAQPGFIAGMKRILGDEVKFVLDIKQAVRAGFSPHELCSVMGSNIVHVHVNDHTAQDDCLLPGKGNMDFAKLKASLDSFGYTGKFIIEVYNNNFKTLDHLVESARYLEDIL